MATVHWHSDDWAGLQVRKLRQFIDADLQLYAFMDGVSDALAGLFDRVFYNDDLSHDQKLDFLAEQIAARAEPQDLLIFIDGDAFPIAELDSLFPHLARYPLIAVKREENFGDQQPHPCFCITTVGFWQQVGGTWKPGYKWQRIDGQMGTDVGGELYGLLDRGQYAWEPLLRSNRRELHPLFFGIYGDRVYHHGAGFRDKLCRRDAHCGIDGYSASLARLIERLQGRRSTRWLRQLLRKHMYWYMRRKNQRLHREVMARILRDDDFTRSLGLTPKT
ncbi:hypothetical protein [Haliea sp. E17]|uniref:hypothetical protein n=1 Tax=Haliea sp. E17 TaxID=3401576 RepID=UPI003AAFB9B8